METSVRNRLLGIGALWGFILAAVPALVMTRPLELSSFLIVAVVCAIVSGIVATLYAGLRAARRGRRGLSSSMATGLFQGLTGGAIVAVAIWTLMAVSISEASLLSPGSLSDLMRPAVFIGSFFVALSAFLYTLVGGLVLGPLFGAVINRTVTTAKGDR